MSNDILITRPTIEQQVEAIRIDLLFKFYRRDWHGVADCAMDLRELEAYAAGKTDAKNEPPAGA